MLCKNHGKRKRIKTCSSSHHWDLGNPLSELIPGSRYHRAGTRVPDIFARPSCDPFITDQNISDKNSEDYKSEIRRNIPQIRS